MSGNGFADLMEGLSSEPDGDGVEDTDATEEDEGSDEESGASESDTQDDDEPEYDDDDEDEGDSDDEEEGDDGEPKKPRKSSEEKLKTKIKVDGEEIKLELTSKERDELIQKGYAFDKKARELAQERKEVRAQAAAMSKDRDQFKAWLTELGNSDNIIPVLKRSGFPIEEAVAKAAYSLIEELNLPEEERAAKQRERAEKEFQERERALQERERERELSEEQARWQGRLEKWIPRAFDATGLPNEPKFRRLVGMVLSPAMQRGEIISYDDFHEAVQHVQENYGPAKSEPPAKKKKPKHPPAAPKNSSGGRRREKKSKKPERINAADYFSDAMYGDD